MSEAKNVFYVCWRDTDNPESNWVPYSHQMSSYMAACEECDRLEHSVGDSCMTGKQKKFAPIHKKVLEEQKTQKI